MSDAAVRALGRKIAFFRSQRGLSQRDFGAMIERSEAWVSQVERGVRHIDRMTVLRRVADVLGVPLSELAAETPVIAAVSTRPAPADALRSLLSSSLRLSVVIATHSTGPELQPGELERAWELTHAADYDQLLPLLLDLLPRLEAVAHRANGAEQRRAFSDLAHAYHACAAALSKLRETDTAWIAADRAIAAAERAGDPLLMAAGAFRLTVVFQADRRHDQAKIVADTAVTALQSLVERGDQTARTIQGALRLQLAINAARQNAADEAYDNLRLARDASDRLGEDRNDYHTEFGPTNVALHEVAIAVEVGDAGTALRSAAAIDAAGLSPERQARLLIDIARAHLQRRHFDAAITALCEAEALTPQQVRQHPIVRAMVSDLAHAGNGADQRLRGLAKRMGTPLSQGRVR